MIGRPVEAAALSAGVSCKGKFSGGYDSRTGNKTNINLRLVVLLEEGGATLDEIARVFLMFPVWNGLHSTR